MDLEKGEFVGTYGILGSTKDMFVPGKETKSGSRIMESRNKCAVELR